MAYSDYGGYAYRNGERIDDRSDATITPGGDTYGTPGAYPGFALAAAGVPHEEILKRIEWPKGHAVLGDGPIYVALYKQWAGVYRGPERISDFHREDYDSAQEERHDVNVEGHRIEIVLTYEDNYYVYCRITQPDGTVWTGFSGYGVGAGLEDCGYGYSTPEREETLLSTFPAEA